MSFCLLLRYCQHCVPGVAVVDLDESMRTECVSASFRVLDLMGPGWKHSCFKNKFHQFFCRHGTLSSEDAALVVLCESIVF